MANIIDGIDVSGCGFIHEDTGTECHIALAFSEEYGECWHCEQIENCYYKQLKRAEIFNKELCKKFNEDMTTLLQENEKLKEEIKLAQELSDQSIEYFGNSREEFKKKSHRYKQALMEIRGIVSEQIDNTDKDDELMCIYGTIYNKINEVIGAEEWTKHKKY